MAEPASSWAFAVRPIAVVDVTRRRAPWAVVPQRTKGNAIETQSAPTTTDDDQRHENPQVFERDLAWLVTDEIDDVQLITVEDTADRLSICRTKVYELIAQQELPTIKIGRSRRVSMDDLRTFVAQHRAG